MTATRRRSKPRTAPAPPSPDRAELLAQVEAIAARAGTVGEFFVDADGNVYRTECPCGRHGTPKRPEGGRPHDAGPFGNLRTNPELAAQFGITTTGGAS